jgi:hypothetical protein
MSLLDSSGLGTVLEFAIGELRRPPTAWASVDPWWEEFRRRRQDWAMPIDQAVLGGVLADRVGYAFAAGYQAALLRLDPGLPADRIVSLSVTEEGGGHPQAIESTLTADGSGGFVLDGRKKWATMSSSGGLALVAAKTGIDDQGRTACGSRASISPPRESRSSRCRRRSSCPRSGIAAWSSQVCMSRARTCCRATATPAA